MQCPCGAHFLADPDDPALYENAEFDILSRKKHLSFSNWMKNSFDLCIKKIYDVWYQIQNFPLLPSKEQYKIIGILIACIVSIAVMAYLVCAKKANPPMEGMTI
ncbi:MAG: hypothetical protein N2316_02180 [Spirochaetes bacterium]|nr:hypothetical protein [Spirochaetota bacterium]